MLFGTQPSASEVTADAARLTPKAQTSWLDTDMLEEDRFARQRCGSEETSGVGKAMALKMVSVATGHQRTQSNVDAVIS